MGALCVMGAVGTANCCGVVLLCMCCNACEQEDERSRLLAMLIQLLNANRCDSYFKLFIRAKLKYMSSVRVL